MFVDTHCHIDDEKLPDKEGVVKDFVRDGIDFVVNMSCDEASALNGKMLAEKFSPVFYGVGIHPENIKDVSGDYLYNMVKYLSDGKCVAVGEIGLDYHYEGFDKDKQKKVFKDQLDFACQNRLPVSIHCRDAVGDMMEILKAEKKKLKYGAVMHCFSGSAETAKELNKMGVFLGFGGTLTFKNAKTVSEVAKKTPIEFCLTETDSPYLSPHPFRGQINRPRNVAYVTARLAEIKGLDLEYCARKVKENALSLFPKIDAFLRK